MLAAESASASDRKEFESRVNSFENLLEERSKEIETLKKKNDQAQLTIKEELINSSNLKAAQNAAVESSKLLETKILELQSGLKKKVNYGAEYSSSFNSQSQKHLIDLPK